MRFVDKDDRRWRNLATSERLDGTDLQGLRRVRAPVIRLHDANAADSLGLEGADGLLYQRDRRHRENDAAILGQSAVNGVRRG